MTDLTQSQTQERIARFDRPAANIPSVDRPWENPADRKDRQDVTKGDKSGHRVYQSLYEDLLA